VSAGSDTLVLSVRKLRQSLVLNSTKTPSIHRFLDWPTHCVKNGDR
jgi:hypothetical protein